MPPKFWLAEAGQALLQRLDYLPMAISQAAAFMKRNQIAIERYLQALNQSDSSLSKT
jgi:hypothetical protein